MPQTLAHITLLIDDYDRAIDYFTRALRFALLEDTPRGPGKRWVRVAPRGASANATGFLLARADTDAQRAHVGNQTGGRVAYFLQTDDFDADYAHMRAHGVTFCETPRDEPYGKVVVFEDCFGNRWDLIRPKPQNSAAQK